MPAPIANIDWTKIPRDASVTEEGKPGARYFVVRIKGKRPAVAFWGGQDAQEAQKFLGWMVKLTAKLAKPKGR